MRYVYNIRYDVFSQHPYENQYERLSSRNHHRPHSPTQPITSNTNTNNITLYRHDKINQGYNQ